MCLIFTQYTNTPPEKITKDKVFPDFWESEQDTEYTDGLTEESRDPETP